MSHATMGHFRVTMPGAEGSRRKVERKGERDHTMANTPVWSQLHEELTRDPLTFLRHLSACLHLEAEGQSEVLREWTVEDVGPVKPWRDTAALMDLAIALWQAESVPAHVRQRSLAVAFEQITAMMHAYFHP